jgi:hypothetical protein
MSADIVTAPGRCAAATALLRGRGRASRVAPEVADHLRTCAACRRTAHEYAALARGLEALAEVPAPDDPRLFDAIARRIDDELRRRLHRTWAVATVAGGLVVAGTAGAAAWAARTRTLATAAS